MKKITICKGAALATISTMLVGCGGEPSAVQTDCCGEKPNVIVVLLDDLGSADVGFNGCHDIPTPNIDRIAQEGANCTNAYISAPYSGPSRAGILTGRYQQRCGVDGNVQSYERSVEEKLGVLPEEVLLSEQLKEQGYNTCAIGKWHLGDHEDLWPQNQGFDYFYGFSGGGLSYWGAEDKSGLNYMQENGVKIEPTDQTYITDDFSNKAVEFINNNTKTGDPFFMYLAYNAPHEGLSAPRRYLDRTTHILNPERSVYAAMIIAVDDGVGQIWDALEANGIDDNTIIVFLSDNGGANYGYTQNLPRRARKGDMYDGGTRTPFAIYWKGRIAPGTEYTNVISSLNIYATAVTAAGCDISTLERPLDGVDMIPYLSGENSGEPNNLLFWRVAGGDEYAVRKGDYKMVKCYHNDALELYNLVEDPSEIYDIAAANPQIIADLKQEYDGWNGQMKQPRWLDGHMPNLIKHHELWLKVRQSRSGNR
ncbi:MAG: sulfatase-like hydrolase/transferase [Rikenellaceae bacterium]